MADLKTELIRFGHMILDGTPAADDDPDEDIPFAQVDVTVTDNCRVAPKATAA